MITINPFHRVDSNNSLLSATDSDYTVIFDTDTDDNNTTNPHLNINTNTTTNDNMITATITSPTTAATSPTDADAVGPLRTDSSNLTSTSTSSTSTTTSTLTSANASIDLNNNVRRRRSSVSIHAKELQESFLGVNRKRSYSHGLQQQSNNTNPMQMVSLNRECCFERNGNLDNAEEALSRSSNKNVREAAERDDSEKSRKKLKLAASLCFMFFVLELFAGVWADSLSILSDSFHLLSDVAGFYISHYALQLSRKQATPKYSYGLGRVEILGAMLSTFMIWIVTGFLVTEAIERVKSPVPIDSKVMFVTALIGVAVNVTLGMTLHSDDDHHDHHQRPLQSPSNILETSFGNIGTHKSVPAFDIDGENVDVAATNITNIPTSSMDESQQQEQDSSLPSPSKNLLSAISTGSWSQVINSFENMNVNVRAAAVHVIGDLISSVGVLIASIIIMIYPSWTVVDPICTFFFSVCVLATTIPLMKTSTELLMESTPSHIDIPTVLESLKSIPGVEDIHNLHIWSINAHKVVLTAHIIVNDPTTSNSMDSFNKYLNYNSNSGDAVLRAAQKILSEQFGIDLVTIQIETGRS
ncbi:hypothetical protein HDU76_007536 [Blyttiomyces sp. JEL0837]|nr:hypothetical protein HDU76_007536 [Blyttiomyces sp. JEL0837]